MIRRARPYFLFFHAATSISKQPPSSSTFSGALLFSSVSYDHFQDISDHEESPDYTRHRRWRRPPPLSRSMLCPNACSLIGTVTTPIWPVASKTDRLGAYAFLDVESSPALFFSSFRIIIWMWDDLARVALTHLKQNDFIYVCGRLSFYEKIGIDGTREDVQKVLVTDLSYVEHQRSPEGEEELEVKKRERLRLWQIFFASPHEWWDNRRTKLHHRSPDFKHKHTGESLWIDPRDPPWVMKQLDRIDHYMPRPVDFRNRRASDLL